jgi:uncharacterized repeat protein (TIGR02543 family)
MQQIASVSSYNTSYTDNAPQDAQPLYAIEYVLANSSSQAPKRTESSVVPSKAPAAVSMQGRSNIVNRVAAKTMTYAQSLTILSANGKYETTEDNTMLLLYAEVMPSNTTYKQVVWEITEGATLATIDQSSGLLTARTPNDGGTITVKATAVDGSGVTATRQIRIAAIKDNTPVEPTYFTVTFYSWDGTVITTQTVEQGKSATAPQAPQRDGYTFVGWDKDFTNVQSDLKVIAVYEKNGTPQPITVRLYPNEWQSVYLYAWTGAGETQPCGVWPGTAVSKDDNGWWTYTFDESIKNINISWNNGAGSQTVDIVGVTTSACYQIGDFNGKYDAYIIDCETGEKFGPKPENLHNQQEGYIVYFLWDAVEGATEYEFVLTQNENIIYSAATDRNSVELDFSKQQPGNYSVEWKVRTTLPVVSDWATATYTIVVTDIDEVEVKKQWSPRKVIENGHVYIILPNGQRYDIVGRRTE